MVTSYLPCRDTDKASPGMLPWQHPTFLAVITDKASPRIPLCHCLLVFLPQLDISTFLAMKSLRTMTSTSTFLYHPSVKKASGQYHHFHFLYHGQGLRKCLHAAAISFFRLKLHSVHTWLPFSFPFPSFPFVFLSSSGFPFLRGELQVLSSPFFLRATVS
jgi:hypothetical protein